MLGLEPSFPLGGLGDSLASYSEHPGMRAPGPCSFITEGPLCTPGPGTLGDVSGVVSVIFNELQNFRDLGDPCLGGRYC